MITNFILYPKGVIVQIHIITMNTTFVLEGIKQKDIKRKQLKMGMHVLRS